MTDQKGRGRLPWHWQQALAIAEPGPDLRQVEGKASWSTSTRIRLSEHHATRSDDICWTPDYGRLVDRYDGAQLLELKAICTE